MPAANATTLGGLKGTGAAILCTGTQKMNGWGSDGTMACAADQTGAVTMTEVEIDVGTTPLDSFNVSVTDATVSASSKILVTASSNAATDKTADEAEMDTLLCSALPASGSFTVYCIAVPGPVTDKFKIFYTVGS